MLRTVTGHWDMQVARVQGTHSGVGDTHVTRAMGTFTGSEFMQRCWGHVGTQTWLMVWGHAEVLGTVTGGDMHVALVMGTLKWWELVQVLGTCVTWCRHTQMTHCRDTQRCWGHTCGTH